jgi:hypothetical protein
MDIIEKIVNLANIFDSNKKYAEADALTKVANEVANLRIANPKNLNQMIGDQNRLNNTQTRIKNTLEETSNLKKQAPIQASSDDDDDDGEREAGITSLTTFKNDQLTTNKLNKEIGKTVDTIERLKSSSTNRKAKMVNLTGIANQQKQTNYLNKQIGKTVEQLNNMKNYAEKEDTEEKTGEREMEEDKKAISLTTLPIQQKQENSVQNNIQRSLKRVEQMKQDKP